MPKQVKKLAFDEFIGLPSTENIKDPETKRILDHYAMAIRWMWERMPRYYKEYEFQAGSGLTITKSPKLGWEVQGGQTIAKKIKEVVKIDVDPSKLSTILIEDTAVSDDDDIEYGSGGSSPTMATTLSVVTDVYMTGSALKQTKKRVTVMGTSDSSRSTIASVSDCPGK